MPQDLVTPLASSYALSLSRQEERFKFYSSDLNLSSCDLSSFALRQLHNFHRLTLREIMISTLINAGSEWYSPRTLANSMAAQRHNEQKNARVVTLNHGPLQSSSTHKVI